jgi:hypothetical protein
MNIRQNLTVVWLGVITASVAVIAWRQLAVPAQAAPPAPAAQLPREATFDKLTVHRIDIVEPDGKPRLILSNKPSFPGAIFDGKEYPHPGRDRGGMLFFNDDGTEAGGILYNNDKSEHGAGAVWTMDQYNQDETLALKYEEADGKRGAGLVVFGDRPNKSLLPALQANAELVAAKTDADKQKAQAKFDKALEESAGKPTTAVFVGRQVDESLLVLSDKTGNPRLVLQVDAAGEPSVQLLDANGKVAKKIAAK